jgi:hypothetical protein
METAGARDRLARSRFSIGLHFAVGDSVWQWFFCAASAADRAPEAKRKGLQLALEPLNGRGIAGYVPKP